MRMDDAIRKLYLHGLCRGSFSGSPEHEPVLAPDDGEAALEDVLITQRVKKLSVVFKPPPVPFRHPA